MEVVKTTRKERVKDYQRLYYAEKKCKRDYCAICDKNYLDSYMEEHCKTKYHQRNLSRNYVMKLFLDKVREKENERMKAEGEALGLESLT